MLRRGINRPDIEEPVRAIVLRVTGLPEANVFFARDQAAVVAPTRPFVSLFIRTPSTQHRAGQVDHVAMMELWRFQVDGSADGAYVVNVSGVDHTVNAVGLDQTQLRNALVSELAASTTSTTAATGLISGDVEANEPRERLLVTVSSPGDTLSIVKLRGNIVEVTRTDVEPELEIFCWGLFDQASPGSEDYGEHTAEDLGAAFLSPKENAALVRAGHQPRLVRYREADRTVDGEPETIGVITITLGAILCHVTDLDDTTQAGIDCQLA